MNISNDDIVDGNPKLTLGLMWYIISHFQVIHTCNLFNTYCTCAVLVIHVVKDLFGLWDTVEPRLSGPRLSGLFDYPDFFSGPVFFMNINKL